MNRYHAIIALIVALASIGTATAVHASQWEPRPGCSYTIPDGQTSWGIQRETGTTIADLVAVNPAISDPAFIRAGDLIDICPAPAHGTGQTEAAPRLSDADQRLAAWARIVEANRPEWADAPDVRFLVAVAGPESNGCDPRFLANQGDAAPPKWGPSVDCVQIRTLGPSYVHLEPHRDRAWLESDRNHVAQAAFIILGSQGRTAWGPVTDGKLPSESCTGASDVGQCVEWWADADRAIANGRVLERSQIPT